MMDPHTEALAEELIRSMTATQGVKIRRRFVSKNSLRMALAIRGYELVHDHGGYWSVLPLPSKE